jgi:hypothetical protein
MSGPVYGPPPGPPAADGAPGGAGAGSGAVTGAGVLLLIVGIGTLLYNAWDLVLLIQDVDLASEFGLGGLLWTLIAIDALLVIFAALQIIGGIRSLAPGGGRRTLGVVGSAGVIGAWMANLVVVLVRGLSLNALAWIVLTFSVVGSAVALILLLAAGRQAARQPGPGLEGF